MKQNDYILIGVMVFISAVVAIVVSRFFFSSSGDKRQTAEKVDIIRPEFSKPPKEYFNVNSVNPTQLITIGDANNPNPFNNKAD